MYHGEVLNPDLLFDRGRCSRGSCVILEELGVLNALNMLERGKRNVAFEN